MQEEEETTGSGCDGRGLAGAVVVAVAVYSCQPAHLMPASQAAASRMEKNYSPSVSGKKNRPAPSSARDMKIKTATAGTNRKAVLADFL